MNPSSLLDVLAPAGWPTFALVLSRTLGLAAAAPAWSSTLVPVRIRVALAIALSVVLGPLVPHRADLEASLALPAAVGAELLVGVAIGLTASLLMHAATLAGELASVQMGLSLSTVFDPVSESNTSQLAQLSTLLVLVLYLTMGGPLVLIRGLGYSLAAVPPGSGVDLAALGRVFVANAAIVFEAALRLAAPVTVALFLTNVALAILTRAVPQLSAFMVAFPLTVGFGLVVFGASLPFRQGLLAQLFRWIPGATETVIRALAPVAAR
ncbi:MAG TPA: flagellar biosynthetic protein FliR [Gemmatimonadales bacterium]|nr:flagellar biosynthetic protein FliR [Gemmatimonadales bacterium]